MATKIQDLTNIGTITEGDKLVGERVDGTTVRLSYDVDITLDSAPALGGHLNMGDYNIIDANGNELFVMTKVASAVNELTVKNAATGNNPILLASGNDSNIGINVTTKGTGQVKVNYEDSRTNTTVFPLNITATTSGTATTNIGAGYSVNLENASGTSYLAGSYAFAASDATAGSEDTYASLNLVVAGNASAEKYRWASTSTTSKLTFTHAASADRTVTWQDVDGTVYVSTGTDVIVSDGGTGRSTATAYAPLCGGTTATGAHQSTTTGSSGQLFVSQGAASLPTWTTPTYPTSSATSGKIIQSDGTNFITSTPTWPTSASTLGKRVKSDGTNLVMSTTTMPDNGTLNKFLIGDGTNYVESTSTIPSSAGATANKVLLSDGTNYVLSTPTFPNASATSLKYICSDGTNWIASTSTFPDSYTQGDILYCSAANVMSALGKDTNSTRYLSNTGTSNNPAWAQVALTTGVTGVLPVANGGTNASSASITAFNNITGYTAAGATGTTSTNLVFSTSPTLVTPTLGAATATSLTFSPTTSGIVGTTTNDAASAGKVGEIISSTILVASAISLTNSTAADVTSISLTAGDWDVEGSVSIACTGNNTSTIRWISSTSATLPDAALRTALSLSSAGGTYAFPIARQQFSLSGTTTVYLSAYAAFSTGAATACGHITARRVR